ncbi:hypothetical protein [Streptomyces sp. TRM64462]|uniref:hypothetical protein n=1 Tax=Streptomyces sp. TRM64462 TaxID=2741726 RepID=UPI0015867CD0|nr:hypothetical protein [Streptomyces sp. TRM64462]
MRQTEVITLTDWVPHPELLVSKTAAGYLGRTPDHVLTAKQVRKAVQLAHDVHGVVPDSLTVAQLRVLFTSPPDWLLDHHRALVAKGVATVRHEVVLLDEPAPVAERAAAAQPTPAAPAAPAAPPPPEPVSGTVRRQPPPVPVQRASLMPVFREPVT